MVQREWKFAWIHFTRAKKKGGGDILRPVYPGHDMMILDFPPLFRSNERVGNGFQHLILLHIQDVGEIKTNKKVMLKIQIHIKTTKIGKRSSSTILRRVTLATGSLTSGRQDADFASIIYALHFLP